MGLVRPDLEISPRTYTRRNIRLDVSIFYQEILSYLRLISHNRWKFADSKIRKFKDSVSPVSTKIVKKSVRFRTVFCQFIRLYNNFFLHCDVQRKFRNSGSWRDRWMADSSIPWRGSQALVSGRKAGSPGLCGGARKGCLGSWSLEKITEFIVSCRPSGRARAARPVSYFPLCPFFRLFANVRPRTDEDSSRRWSSQKING